MRNPDYTLFVRPDHEERKDILEGLLKITIRFGHRDYREGGLLMLCCHIVPWAVLADISSVRHCILGEVTIAEMKELGFNSLADLAGHLGKFYNDITVESPMTVIRWTNVRGFLVDNAKDYKRNPAALYASIDHQNY